MLSLFAAQASCYPNPFFYLGKALNYYVRFPIETILLDKQWNYLIEQGFSAETISKALNVSQSDVDDYIDLLCSIHTDLTPQTNMMIIYYSLGLSAERVQEIAKEIKDIPAYLDYPFSVIFGDGGGSYNSLYPPTPGLTFEEFIQIITPINQHWDSLGPAFSALNLNEKKIGATLKKIIKEAETITISDVLTSLGLSKDKAVSILNKVSALMSSSTTTIGEVLSFFGIRESSFIAMNDAVSKVLKKRSATKEEIKQVFVTRATFDFEALGNIFNNVSDIIVSTLGTVITKDKLSVKERANILAKSFNSYKELLGESAPKSIDTICTFLTNFSKDGVDIKTLLDLDEDELKIYNRIVNFAKKLLDGKANYYDIYNFTAASIYTEDHLTERVFKLLKDAKSTMKLIIGAVSSLNDIVIDFLTTMLQLNDKSVMSYDYKLLKREEFSKFNIYFFGDAIKQVTKYLTKTNIEIFSMYKNNTKLINEEFSSIFNEGIKALSIISSGILNGIEEGKTIEKSLQKCLSSIKTSEYEHVIAYLLDAVDPSNSSLEENIKDDINSLLAEIKQAYNESSNLEDFYNKVYELNWTKLVNEIGDDENISQGIMKLFPADKIYNASINGALSLLIDKYWDSGSYTRSAAGVILCFFTDKGEFPSWLVTPLFDFVDFFVKFMTEGKLTIYNYLPLIKYDENLQVFKRIFNALASNNASKTLTKIRADCFYDFYSSIIEAVDKLGFKSSSLIIKLLVPYKWFFKKFMDGFSGKDLYGIVSKDIEPGAISNTFNLFMRYADTFKTNSSFYPVLKELLGYDIEGILSPINETLQAIHNYLKDDDVIYNRFSDIRIPLKIYKRLSEGNEYNLKLLFGIGHCYHYYAEALNYIIDNLRNKNYLKVDKREAKSILEKIKKTTEKIESEFDSEFTFKSFVDNNTFIFSDLFKKIANGYNNNESVVACIESLNLTPLLIEQTLNNLCNYSQISYLNFVNSFVFKTDAGNDELISFATSYDSTTTIMNVSSLNTLVGYDLCNQTNAITESTNSPVSYLPEKGAVISQSNLRVLSNVVSDVDSGKFNSEAVDSAIQQIIENSKQDSKSSKLSSGKITVIVACSVAAVAIVVIIVVVVVLKLKRRKDPVLLTESLTQMI